MTRITNLNSAATHAVGALAVGLALWAPAQAQAAASVTSVGRTAGVLEITDVSDGNVGHAQDITISQVPVNGEFKVRLTRHGGLGMAPAVGSGCSGNADVLTCDLPSSVHVLAGGQDDDFVATANLFVPVHMQGGAGDDELRGGGAGDRLEGDSGDDLLGGNGGNDTLIGGQNADRLDGGAGTRDLAFYEPDRAAGVTVSVANGLPEDGSAIDQTVVGGGTERDEVIGSVEAVEGTNQRDVIAGAPTGLTPEILRGKGGDDDLIGQNGNDELEGGAGRDHLFGGGDDDRLVGGTGRDALAGGTGVDTADYSDHDGGVGVTIGNDTDQDGNAAEDDGPGLESVGATVENVVGSPGATGDRLTGSAADELLSGLAGNDVLDGGLGADSYSGGDGDDTIRARDGIADTAIDCGAGIDTVIADAADPVGADCENVQRPAAPGVTVRDTVFDLSLIAKGRQRLARKRALAFELRCPSEACTVTVRATLRVGKRKLRLRGTRRSLAAGQAATVKLKLSKRQLRTLRTGLKRRKRVRVQIVADGLDAAGNRSRQTRTVRVTR